MKQLYLCSYLDLDKANHFLTVRDQESNPLYNPSIANMIKSSTFPYNFGIFL